MQTKVAVHSDKKMKKKVKDILVIILMGVFIVPVAVFIVFYTSGVEDEL